MTAIASTYGTPWRWDVGSYHAAVDAGVFGPEPRIQLIEGEVYPMTPQNTAHATAMSALVRSAGHLGATGFVARVQLPITLSDRSEPEPDLVVATGRISDFALRHPGPGDVALLVEVSDSSLRFDRTVKLALYAATGIPEVWVVDLVHRQVLVFRDPQRSARRYRSERIFEGPQLLLHSGSGLAIMPDELWPAPTRPDR
ncbi:MAG: Uma2 family endonuclease [Acidimicrobiales bacterium]